MPEKDQRGPKSAPPGDPFELSPEDFDKALEEAQVAGDSVTEEPPAKKNQDDTGPNDKREPAPAGATPAPVEAGPIDLTLPKAEPVQAPAKPPGDKDEFFELVHHGQVHRLTRDKLINLAQKGFDYEAKVGPHQRIVQLVDSDPRAAALLDSYVRGQLPPVTPDQPAALPTPPPPPPPKLKPLTDYSSETEWLQDNFQVLQAALKPADPAAMPSAPAMAPTVPVVPGTVPVAPVPAPAFPAEAALVPTTPPVSAETMQTESVLAGRDPYAYNIVAPELDNYARRLLTAEQYDLVNRGDIPMLIRFYDQVRPRILKDKNIDPASLSAPGPAPSAAAPGMDPIPPKGDPSFRAKPGGGTPPRETGGELAHAWEKNDDEFQHILARAKGYE